MNLLERVLMLLKANLNSVIEKSDDPEEALRRLQLDMRNQLVQVKTQVATAISESRKMQARAAEKKAEADAWYKKAASAVQHDNDTSAREALTRYNDSIKLALRYQKQQLEQDQLVTTMRNALRQLEAKIAEVETTIELLATRKRNALLQQRVYDALSKSGSQGEKERAQANRAQDAVLEAEARARAMADLHSRDLDTQLDQLSAEQLIQQQLDKLKSQQRAAEPPLLTDGSQHRVSLLPPIPQDNEPARKRPPKQATQASQANQPQPSQRSELSSPLDIEELKRLMEK